MRRVSLNSTFDMDQILDLIHDVVSVSFRIMLPPDTLAVERASTGDER